MSDSLNQLANVLYGRAAMPADYIGGSDARIFHDAADKITTLEDSVIPIVKVTAALEELRVDAEAGQEKWFGCNEANIYQDFAESIDAIITKLGLTPIKENT